MNEKAIKYHINIGKKVSTIYYVDNNLWLTLNNISELFSTNINRVYQTLESLRKRVKIPLSQYNRYIEIPLQSGISSRGSVYSLEIAIAIGYMINPKKAMELHKSSLELFKIKREPLVKENRGFFNRLFL